MKVRVVFDTNVLIDGAADNFGAAARLIDAASSGVVTALVTPAMIREYRQLTRRLISDAEYQEHLDAFLAAAHEVEPAIADVVIDDLDDRKFLAAALGGKAQLVVTSDRHLLDIGEVGAIQIVTPAEAWTRVSQESGGESEWQSWAEQLGLG